MDETNASNERELAVYGDIFTQMLQFDWFRDIVETRFDIHKRIDDEEKVITMLVVEVPPQETMKRAKKRMESVKIEVPATEEKLFDIGNL